MDNSILKDTAFQDRRNAFEVFYNLKQRIDNKEPSSLIRLGDGEGTILGFPDLASRARVNSFFNTWYGKFDFPDDIAMLHHNNLKLAISNADTIGLPRVKQLNKSPNWAVVEEGLLQHRLVKREHLITDAAIHRYLTFALQYRGLLEGQTFLGLISCRDLTSELSSVFKIPEVKHYSIQGESKFPGLDEQPHFPDRFYELEQTIEVPHRGAIFLVGAGVLGKTYCHWIKERGGIAIDIGSICDAWASVPSRTKHPIHKLERYQETPKITLEEACLRFNNLLDELNLDSKRVSRDELPKDFPEYW